MPNLLVCNKAGMPVLILDGETLIGTNAGTSGKWADEPGAGG